MTSTNQGKLWQSCGGRTSSYYEVLYLRHIVDLGYVSRYCLWVVRSDGKGRGWRARVTFSRNYILPENKKRRPFCLFYFTALFFLLLSWMPPSIFLHLRSLWFTITEYLHVKWRFAHGQVNIEWGTRVPVMTRGRCEEVTSPHHLDHWLGFVCFFFFF